MWHVLNHTTHDEYLTPSWSLAKEYMKQCMQSGDIISAHYHAEGANND